MKGRPALLVAATFLVGPYTMNYDLLLLMPSIVTTYRRSAAVGFYPAEYLVCAQLWLMPSWDWMLNQHGLPVMLLAILIFGALAWKQLLDTAKVELPGPAMAR